ncbi:MAG: hypothetical protein DRG78_00825 [Epsilonproteobacteria bacterium]|nr:MAG: hypothetical protein DRG78_00825 [Campylobacterota bacterium]
MKKTILVLLLLASSLLAEMSNVVQGKAFANGFIASQTIRSMYMDMSIPKSKIPDLCKKATSNNPWNKATKERMALVIKKCINSLNE